MAWGKFLALLSVLTTVSALATLRRAGPYDASITHMENCSEPDSNDVIFDLKKTKMSTKWAVFDGTVILKKDLDENISVAISAYYRTSFGYGKFYYGVYRNPCVEIKQMIDEVYTLLVAELGMNPDECPIKAGVYKAQINTTLPTAPELPSLIYGDYKIFAIYFDNNPPSRIGCIAAYFTISERPLS